MHPPRQEAQPGLVVGPRGRGPRGPRRRGHAVEVVSKKAQGVAGRCVGPGESRVLNDTGPIYAHLWTIKWPMDTGNSEINYSNFVEFCGSKTPTAAGGGGVRPGTILQALKSPKLPVPYAQMTATKQQRMHQTECPKLQHMATTWPRNCVFQEEPSAPTNAPELNVPSAASYSSVLAPGPSQKTQCLQHGTVTPKFRHLRLRRNLPRTILPWPNPPPPCPPPPPPPVPWGPKNHILEQQHPR